MSNYLDRAAAFVRKHPAAVLAGFYALALTAITIGDAAYEGKRGSANNFMTDALCRVGGEVAGPVVRALANTAAVFGAGVMTQNLYGFIRGTLGTQSERERLLSPETQRNEEEVKNNDSKP